MHQFSGIISQMKNLKISQHILYFIVRQVRKVEISKPTGPRGQELYVKKVYTPFSESLGFTLYGVTAVGALSADYL